jgi:hypothetical protein
MSKKNDPMIAKLQKSIDANIAELKAGPGPRWKQYALDRYRRERAASGQATELQTAVDRLLNQCADRGPSMEATDENHHQPVRKDRGHR